MNRDVVNSGNSLQSGFTLVEVLVSIAIMLLIAPLAIEGVRTGLETWNRLEQRAEVMDRARTAQRVIRKQISEALPFKVNDDAVQDAIHFQGSRNAVEFVANLPGHVSGGGLFINRIEQAVIDDEAVLLLSYRPLNGTAGGDAETQRVVLGRGVERIELGYYGALNLRAGAAWHAHWDNQAQLPQRVRLQVWREKGGYPLWSELTIPVYAAPRSS